MVSRSSNGRVVRAIMCSGGQRKGAAAGFIEW